MAEKDEIGKVRRVARQFELALLPHARGTSVPC
jgi:hypothetical protein